MHVRGQGPVLGSDPPAGHRVDIPEIAPIVYGHCRAQVRGPSDSSGSLPSAVTFHTSVTHRPGDSRDSVTNSRDSRKITAGPREAVLASTARPWSSLFLLVGQRNLSHIASTWPLVFRSSLPNNFFAESTKVEQCWHLRLVVFSSSGPSVREIQFTLRVLVHGVQFVRIFCARRFSMEYVLYIVQSRGNSILKIRNHVRPVISDTFQRASLSRKGFQPTGYPRG